jgi:hypothetical protein
MKNLTFYDLLSSSLLKTEQAQLVSIIDRDPVLAAWLQEGGFKKYYIDLGKDYRQTSLLSYGFVALDLPEDILNQALNEKKYLPLAVRRFEALRKSENQIEGFKEASLISLALYERWVKVNSWKGLFTEIDFNNKKKHFSIFQSWQTVLSILFCASNSS